MTEDFLGGLLDNLSKADGGIAMTLKEFSEAQFGIPLKHYAQQYIFGSTGLRYGAMYLLAGKPKSCKSPFVFEILKQCCECGGVSYLYELEGKASPTLLMSMFHDHPDWITDKAKSPFKMITDKTLDQAEDHLVKKVFKTFNKLGEYRVPLCVDWDSISGAAMSDVVDKIESTGTAGKGFVEKPHVMKYFTESWTQLVGKLPVVFLGVLQTKEKTEGIGPMSRVVDSYGGGTSQLFKAGTLLSFSYSNLQNGTGKIVNIKTALSGFSDARRLKVKFTWNQFGDLETESQGHKWQWAEASAQCLATPEVVGNLRDIVDVKISPEGLVTCRQLDVTKVTPEEFEESLMSEEHKEIRENLYKYQKIERIKLPSEYADFVAGRQSADKAEKEADKAAAKAEKEAIKAAEQAKLEAKRQKKESKVAKPNVELSDADIAKIFEGKKA